MEEDLEEVYAIDEQLQRLDAQEEGAMDVLRGIQVCSTRSNPALHSQLLQRSATVPKGCSAGPPLAASSCEGMLACRAQSSRSFLS